MATMNNIHSKIIRQADLNHDGIMDRVTAQCSEEQNNVEVCQNFQVELGLTKGGFISVFDSKTVSERSPLEEGDTVSYSPEYFAQVSTTSALPGKPLPFAVRMAQSPGKLLTTKELIDACDKRISPEERGDKMACETQAVQAPLEHIYQPETATHPENPNLIYFTATQKNTQPLPPLPLPLLIKAEAVVPNLYAPPQFGSQLNANLFENVKDKSSRVLAEYLYAQSRGVVSEKFVAETILSHWDVFGWQLLESEEAQKYPALQEILEKRENNAPLKAEELVQKLDDLYFQKSLLRSSKDFRQNESRAQKYIKALSLIPTVSPAILMRLLDWMLGNKAIHQRFEGATLQLAVTVLENKFKDPDMLSPLVDYLLEESQKNIWNEPAWQNKRPLLLPSLDILLSSTSDPKKIPPTDKLLRLADQFVDLQGTILVAAANRKEKNEKTLPLFDKLSRSPSIRDRKIVIYSAQNLLGEKAIPYLLSLTHDSKEEVRLSAYKALTSFDSNNQQIIEAFKISQPPEAFTFLSKQLMEEEGEEDLQWTAQALVQLAGLRALAPIFARLEKHSSPESLFETAIQIASESKKKEAVFAIYPFLFHYNAKIRKETLAAIHAFDGEELLKALIRDSYHPQPLVRTKIAEALATYNDVRAIRRLMELTKDPNKEVQKQAVTSLSQIKNPKTRKKISEFLPKLRMG